MGPRGRLSVIIVNWNGGEALLSCLASLFKSAAGADLEVWLVDNHSTDGSAQKAMRAFPAVRLIQNEANLGFARAANQALSVATGDWFLLLNPDVELNPAAVAAMQRIMQADPTIGMVGCPSLDHDGRLSPAHEHTYPGARGRAVLCRAETPEWEEVAWTSGACLLARREMVQQVGLLDEQFFMYYEDVDWCYRARQAGWRVVTLRQHAIRHHLGGAARLVPREVTAARAARSRVRFFRKHYSAARAAYLIAGFAASNLLSALVSLPLAPFSRAMRARGRLCLARLAALFAPMEGRRPCLRPANSPPPNER